MPWKPEYPGEFPTLGHEAVQWMIDNLAAPDKVDYAPYYPTSEQYEFLMHLYEIDPRTGKRFIRRAVLSRGRGWGKSPFLSAIALFEALGNAVADGWDANGRPVARPWASIRYPQVDVAAASEAQVWNAWRPLMEMCREDAPMHRTYSGVEPFKEAIMLPYGQIRAITSSTTSAKGSPSVLVLSDQTEQWLPSNGGIDLADVLLANTAKTGGLMIESPNAYIPGMNSLAERTATAWLAQQEGRSPLDKGLYYDHREAAPDTQIMDRESLIAGLRWTYGDSSGHPDGCVIHDPPCDPGWVDLDRLVARAWDADSDEQKIRSDFLNQITFASDSWLGDYEWRGRRYDVVYPEQLRLVDSTEPIVLGFDGSRGRAKGKPDATALVACAVKDGYMWPVRIWEAEDRAELWKEWEPPLTEIEDTIDRMFREHNVVGFFADPARDWRSYVNEWEAKYGARLRVKSSARHPIEWWMLGGRAASVESAVEELESAIRTGVMTHSGDDRLTAHMLNARRRITHGKLALGKESSSSIRKIDGAVAAVLAWRARQEAVAMGLALPQARRVIPKRIR